MDRNNTQNEKKKKCDRCQICGKEFSLKKLFPGTLVRNGVVDLIVQKHPEWDGSKFICFDDLDNFRALYIEKIIKEDQGALSKLDDEVVESVKEHDLITEDINKKINADLSFGEKLADKIAAFGGSWTFITLFILIILLWAGINVASFSLAAFDPYPFILLNLVLSCLAAIQAPIIMMTQNRQSKREHIQSDYEYMINLKAELEIQHINAKIDQLMRDQWSRMIEIQNIQIDLMKEIREHIKKK